MALVTRNTKGSPLTWTEMDNNLMYLEQEATAGTGTFLPLTGNTSGNCVSNLYVDNIYGCSDLTIHSSIQHTYSTASGLLSTAFGYNTTASGLHSHAQGGGTTAIGSSSHAQGSGTITIGMVARGERNKAGNFKWKYE